MKESVSEFDVLCAAALWLQGLGTVEAVVVSPARGQELSLEEQKRQLKEKLHRVGCENISFSTNGPDIIARDKSCIWKVECKGLGRGASSTLDNNFDRALASVVSYYDEPAGEGHSGLSNVMSQLANNDKPTRLALALPNSDRYMNLLRKNVRPALRRRLDLWLLIIDPLTSSVECYNPTREF
ncbi:MAG: hypothetical protein HZB34_07215 [Nitrospirae bacterium]|nr:hypothetical protein [Nitrospirota bacterium]